MIPFIDHPGGNKIYVCSKCSTPLVNVCDLESCEFSGSTGPAYLFRNVVNVQFSRVETKAMSTGSHMVRDISCIQCHTKIGWDYVLAMEPDQQYKEGKFILEKSLIIETE
ncbi:MAG: Protein yippee-like 5 [Marteilia pararefringens]